MTFFVYSYLQKISYTISTFDHNIEVAVYCTCTMKSLILPPDTDMERI